MQLQAGGATCLRAQACLHALGRFDSLDSVEDLVLSRRVESAAAAKAASACRGERPERCGAEERLKRLQPALSWLLKLSLEE
eukprot:499031-Prymnesium_polylepis.1